MTLDDAILQLQSPGTMLVDNAALVKLLLELKEHRKSTVRLWVTKLPRMQQAVILGAIRGPDGVAKEHLSKHAVRWFRRCALITAFDKREFNDPYEPGGGNYTGPCPSGIDIAKSFLKEVDSLPYHYVTHFVWAAEILGYKHPEDHVRLFWHGFYTAWCKKSHVTPETEQALDERLQDKAPGELTVYNT